MKSFFKTLIVSVIAHVLGIGAATYTTQALALQAQNSYFYCGESGIPLINQKPWWLWSIYLRGEPTEMDQIQSVTYHLHRSFRPQNRTVTKSKRNDRNNRYFELDVYKGWGIFNIRIDIRYMNGTRKQLNHYLQFKGQGKDKSLCDRKNDTLFCNRCP